jgi:vancomycin resistance protein YoaR
MRKRHLILVWIGFVVSLPLAWLISEPQGVMRGVQIAGVPVEGKSYRQLKQWVHNYITSLSQQRITLIVGNQEQVVTAGQLGIQYLPDKLAARAYYFGREFSLMARLRSRLSTLRNPVQIPIPLRVDGERLKASLEQYRVPFQNATVEYRGGRVILCPEVPGAVVEVEAARQVLEHELAQGNMQIVLPTAPLPAPVTVEDLRGVTALRASFSLKMTSNHKGALRNAELAVRALDKAVVMPGSTLSVNERVGPRTHSRGFQIAPVLINARRDSALGGGICAVSSCMFVAAAKANLRFEEARSHSVPVQYVGAGLDCVIDYGRMDLKIKNDTSQPIVFRVSMTGKTITVQVFGEPLRHRVELKVATYHRSGLLIADTFRIVDGKVEKLRRSRYRLAAQGGNM